MDAVWEGLGFIPTVALIFATPAVFHKHAPKAICVENARDGHWKAKIVSRYSNLKIFSILIRLGCRVYACRR